MSPRRPDPEMRLICEEKHDPEKANEIFDYLLKELFKYHPELLNPEEDK